MNNQPSILYVEDDAHSRRVMKLLLTAQMGLQNVTIFENSVDFLDRAEALNPKPDVIFLDIHMEPHTGFEMLNMVRASAKLQATPVVALTASVMNDEVEKLRTGGFDGCIAKPLNIQHFPHLLDSILSGETVWRIIG
ncbi:MAG: response regulator [Anaerolineae bacterium]|nr:response regulator [Anaerolineae bacterium]